MCEAESVRYITGCIFLLAFLAVAWDFMRRLMK